MSPGAVCKIKSYMGEYNCLLSCIQVKSEANKHAIQLFAKLFYIIKLLSQQKMLP